VSRRAEALMGTTVTIEVVAADHDALVDRAFEWFHLVEQTCTRFDPRSELCQLTRTPGVAVPASPVLFEAVRFALHVAEMSNGAFDPTVGAALQRRGFDREHRTGERVPTLVDPAEGVTFRDVTVDEDAHTITLHRPLLLDLGAVAKGLAVDLAARELAPLGDFAIDAGGDLYLAGTNRDGQPWSVGIRHPREPGACIAAVRVSNRAVCTSGNYERTDHIIHSGSGDSPERVASVTVVADSAMLADALATAAFVMGPEGGLPWLARMGSEGLLVTNTLELKHTDGWPGE